MKYDKKLIKEITALVEKGWTYKNACTAVNISQETFNEWRNGNVPKGEDPSEFSEAITRAEDKYKMKQLAHIEAGGTRVVKGKHGEKIVEGDWRANAFILERRFKDEYAAKEEHALTHTLDEGSENARRLVEAIIERARGGGKKSRRKSR